MSKLKIQIAFESGQQIGQGHKSRATALFFELKKIWDEVYLNPVSELEFETPDALKKTLYIFDSYLLEPTWLQNFSINHHVLVFDDNYLLANGEYGIINCNPYASSEMYSNIKGPKFIGKEYLIVKQEFRPPPPPPTPSERDVLVSMGGADIRSLTQPLVKLLKELHLNSLLIIGPDFPETDLKNWKSLAEGSSRIKFLFSPGPSELQKRFLSSKVILISGGQTAYEALLSGKRPIVIETAANQKKSIAYLNHKNLLLESLSWEDPSLYTKLKETLTSLVQSKDEITRCTPFTNGDGARNLALSIVENIEAYGI